jgi:hypothetical protein
VKISTSTRTVPPLEQSSATHGQPGRKFTPRKAPAEAAPREDFGVQARTGAATGTALMTMRDVTSLNATYAAALAPSASAPFVVQQLHQIYAPADSGWDPRRAAAAYREVPPAVGAEMASNRFSA